MTDDQREVLYAVASRMPAQGVATARRLAKMMEELEAGQSPTDIELIQEIAIKALDAGVPGRTAVILLQILDQTEAPE